MKIQTPWMSPLERYWYLAKWHPWFAWYPVRDSYDDNLRWLETVNRKKVSHLSHGWHWEYRAMEEKK